MNCAACTVIGLCLPELRCLCDISTFNLSLTLLQIIKEYKEVGVCVCIASCSGKLRFFSFLVSFMGETVLSLFLWP